MRAFISRISYPDAGKRNTKLVIEFTPSFPLGEDERNLLVTRLSAALISGYYEIDEFVDFLHEARHEYVTPEPEQPTPAAEVIIELSKRVSALEEKLAQIGKTQINYCSTPTPVIEYTDAGL